MMMKFEYLKHSLKIRITLFTLAIFLIGLWSLLFYANAILREDIKQLLGEQQFSSAAFVAQDVEHEIAERITGLKIAAANITLDMIEHPERAQKFLEAHPILIQQYSGGAMVLGLDGKCVASAPLSERRRGVNYADREHVAIALKSGKTNISKGLIGKISRTPLFAVATPIFDKNNRVIGALSGTVDLSKPNFLGTFTNTHYGKSGGYYLVDRKNRMVIAATDKRRVLQPFPPFGAYPTLDRFLDGYEGSAVYMNPFGIEVLGSGKQIAGTDWALAITLPTAEAFAPIDNIQLQMLYATILLTLFAGGVTWWIIRRELKPMADAVKIMAGMAETQEAPQPLPIVREDEIGSMIKGFNHLIQKLTYRDQALLAKTAELKETQHIAQIGNWHLNLVTGELTWSDGIFTMFEIDQSKFAATYEAFLNTIHPDDRDLVNNAYANSLVTRQPYEVAHRLLMSDGRIKWVNEKCTSSFDANGKPLSSTGMVQDVTQSKLAELALIKARDEANSASRAKSAFLSSMSHELRTPMNAILGYSQLMQMDENFPAIHKENVADMLTAGYHLLELISEALDLAKIESGQVDLVFSDVVLCDIIGDCLKIVFLQAEKRNISVSHNGQKDVMIFADRRRLKQVMINLLSNGIKYNREGGKLHIEVKPVIAGKIRILVIDSGAGIAANRLPELFEPFNRLGAESGNIEGTGIGLTITRRIVEAMGGTIGVGSEVGVGSTFWVELPVAES